MITVETHCWKYKSIKTKSALKFDKLLNWSIRDEIIEIADVLNHSLLMHRAIYNIPDNFIIGTSGFDGYLS